MMLNKTLPKRNRSHLLEAESRRKFQNLIPSSWLFNTPTESVEYGLDANIQITRNGNVTGEEFKVQFKATDKDNERPSVSLPISTFNYYQNINKIMPILMVCYQSTTESFYVKWFHNFDPYYNINGQKAKRSKNSKTISFYWNEDEKWDRLSIKKIEKDLELYFKIKQHCIEPPFIFQITSNSNIISNFPLALILSDFNEKVEHLNIIEISFKPQKHFQGKIILNQEEIKAYFLHNGGGCFHFPKNIKFSKEEIVDILIMQLIIALNNINYAALANKLAEILISSEIIITYIKYVDLLIEIFTKNQNWESLIKLLNYLNKYTYSLTSQEEQVALKLYILSILLKYSNCFADKRNLEILKNNIKDALKTHNPETLANTYYNLGNALRKDQYYQAYKYYNLARKSDYRYLERDYFWKEFGGILFLSGKYKWSALCYAKALKLSEKKDFFNLYADALLYSGNFKYALNRFNEYLKKLEQSKLKDENGWLLKLIATDFLIKSSQVYKQKRFPKKANQLIEKYITKKIHPNIQNINKIFNYDLLSAEAWHNYASILQTKNNPNYIMALLCSAVFDVNIEEFVILFINLSFASATDLQIVFLKNEVLNYIAGIGQSKIFIEILSEKLPKLKETASILNFVYQYLQKRLERQPEEERVIRLINGSNFEVLYLNK